MTVALLVALAAVNIAYLVLIDRRDGRDREERGKLLQRIQAPQAAVYEHHAAVVPPAETTSPLPMTDEEMAQMQSQRCPDGQTELQRIIAKMEAAENGSEQIEDGLIA